MADTFFKISVIDGALSLCHHRQQYPALSIEDAVRQLQNGPAILAGYDYTRAVELGVQTGWDAICVDGVRQVQLQETLKRLAIRLKPLWARFSYLGRSRVLQVVSEDQRQCLELAGLLTAPPSEKVVRWWDKLAAYFRTLKEQGDIEIGRKGEQLTIEYETQRLKNELIPKKPIWVALEDNCAGYDVHSFQHTIDGDINDLRIEVKTASYSPTHFILTRTEWDTASKQQNLHIFHIWNLETGELLKLNVSDMAVHIPVDAGSGRWREIGVIIA